MDAWSCPWCKKCDLCGGIGSIAAEKYSIDYGSKEVGEVTLDETCPAGSGMPEDLFRLDEFTPPTPRYFDSVAVTLSSRCDDLLGQSQNDASSYPPGVFAGKPKSLVTMNVAISVFSFLVLVLLLWFW